MVDRRRSQWVGIPTSTQGQQKPYQSVQRFDLIGPFTVSATGNIEYQNIVDGSPVNTGIDFVFPEDCIITEILFGNESESTITVSITVAGTQFNSILVAPSGTADVMGLTRSGICADGNHPRAALAGAASVANVTSIDGTLKIWFSVTRWAG